MLIDSENIQIRYGVQLFEETNTIIILCFGLFKKCRALRMCPMCSFIWPLLFRSHRLADIGSFAGRTVDLTNAAAIGWVRLVFLLRADPVLFEKNYLFYFSFSQLWNFYTKVFAKI